VRTKKKVSLLFERKISKKKCEKEEKTTVSHKWIVGID
jgi:hypothetical protein